MAVDTARPGMYNRAMDEELLELGRYLPAELVRELIGMGRARNAYQVVLHGHEGRVVRTEKRTQRKYT